MLTLASTARAGHYRGGKGHIRLAAAVEFIPITATLLHDDAGWHESALRRGKGFAANLVWGKQSRPCWWAISSLLPRLPR